MKKKKKKVAPQSAEGSHLSSGTMASRPVATALEPGPEPIAASAVAAQPVKKKKKKKAALTGESSHFPEGSAPSDSDSAVDQMKRAQRAAGVLMKQPSVVREDWEGEQEQERTEAQQREDQGLSPVSSPTSVQGRKTTAANMSRKIEEPQVQQSKPSTAPEFHAVTIDEPASPTASSPANNELLQVGQPQRTPSVSPSRSTRFSDRLASDLATGRKHEPLPRSYSPVKSALKHHAHDASPADLNAPQVRDASATPSDASDMSVDGTMRRKKSARVSFQSQPEIVGTGADVEDAEEPPAAAAAASDNKDTGRRGFFGLGRAKPTLTTIPSEDDINEYKPRPQLPSFGSIRGKERRTDSSESVELVTNTPQKTASNATKSPSTSSDSSNSNVQQFDQGVSSDHALSGVVAQQVANQAARFSTYAPALGPPPRDPNLPLPPEVTSVEGSGYNSDFSSSSDEGEPDDMPTAVKAPAPLPVPSTSAAQRTDVKPNAKSQTIPAVAVQPPTPNLDESKAADQWDVEVPGGFPAPTEVTAVQTTKAIPPVTGEPTPALTGLGMAEAGPTAVPVVNVQTPEDSDDESLDNASIYSDAAEDLSDLEGDGFGSINAIVESPIITSSKMADLGTPPQSPLAQVSNRPAETDRTASWDEAQQKWSGIAKQTRETTQQKAQQPPSKTSGAGLEDSKWAQTPGQQTPVAAPQPKPKKKKKTGAALAASLAPSAGLRQPPDSPLKAKNQPSAYPPINTGEGAMRQSMRQQPSPQGPATASIRTSMRTPPPHSESGFRSSMRGSAPAARPISPSQVPAPPPYTPRAALQKKHIPTAPKAAAPVARGPAQKTLSNDSDSDSSFQRARRRRPDTGSYTMRGSMRSGGGPATTRPQSAGRGAVRSLSPPQRRPFSPVGESKAFRQSMRGSFDDTGPTLRAQPQQKRSSSLFGRRKAKSPPPPPLPTKSSPFAAIKSRIKDDSDDEDGPRQKTFTSRFQDSSDEDEPVTVPRVSKAPRRGVNDDSTDLEDSSDDGNKTAKAKPQAPKINTAIAQTPQAGAPLSPTSAKKKGLFSRLRGKKDPDAQGPSSPGGQPYTANSKVAKEEEQEDDDMGNMGFASTAERDEMIRQTMAKLEAAKTNDSEAAKTNDSETAKTNESEAASSSTAGKLQRRGMGQRIMSDSWPLPDKPEADLDTRPNTSSGVPGQTNGSAVRPGLGSRIPTAETTNSNGVAFGRSGKKKRFPMLRKALGLRD